MQYCGNQSISEHDLWTTLHQVTLWLNNKSINENWLQYDFYIHHVLSKQIKQLHVQSFAWKLRS